jgi:membrane protein implicated in regulation of membrane protease activity
MTDLLNDLTIYQKVLIFIGTPSAFLLLVFFIASLFGFGDHDFDFDHDVDSDVDAGHDMDPGLRLFSIKGVIIFLAIFSWTSLFLIDLGFHFILNLITSTAFSLLILYQFSKLFKFMNNLREEKNFNPRDLIGTTAVAVLSMEPNKRGKIHIELTNGGSTEYFALNSTDTKIERGDSVFIEGYLEDSGIYVVDVI